MWPWFRLFCGTQSRVDGARFSATARACAFPSPAIIQILGDTPHYKTSQPTRIEELCIETYNNV
jgi:hypothetical protein